jgi:hypothetical protein
MKDHEMAAILLASILVFRRTQTQQDIKSKFGSLILFSNHSIITSTHGYLYLIYQTHPKVRLNFKCKIKPKNTT